MTISPTFVCPKKKKAVPSFGQLSFGLFSLFCLLLLLKNSEIAIESMRRGLKLCATTLIPSLFPFMVLSEMMVSGGIDRILPRWVTRPLQKIFGLPPAGCCAIFPGLLCGFPIGARCAVSAYESGRLTREEAQHVLLFSNNPSSAFLINAVGVSLFGSRAFGVTLYGVVIVVSLFTGFLFARLRKKEEEAPLTEPPLSPNPPLRGAGLFTHAITSATGGMLLICAYVVFFSSLCGALRLILSSFHIPMIFQSLVFGLLELTSGVSQAATVSEPLTAAVLCAFAAGWSGLSVHCQVLSVCDGKGFAFRNYFLAKLLQGLLCALLFGMIISCGWIIPFSR